MPPASDRLRIPDDGLITPDVGRWSEEKYRLLDLYCTMFSTGMKNKWEHRVYIDLYAGAGASRIGGTAIHLKGSPLIALTVPDPFTKYVFCEEDEGLMYALRRRARKVAPGAKATFLAGACDDNVDQILEALPGGKDVLCLCVVDPFDFGLKFETLRKLSAVRMDFLVLLAIGTDANRNYDHYVDGNSPKINEALGGTAWRDRWLGTPRKEFRKFLAVEFSTSMESLGYRKQEVHRMKHVRSDERNLPLYYLALFSRSAIADKFWDEVLKYGSDQQSFW